MEELAATPVPDGLDGLAALFEYAGPGRDVVLGLKHTRGVTSVPELADALAAAVREARWHAVPSVVTWLPTTSTRRRLRGYDQSRLLAKAVARRTGLPCRRLLARSGRHQQGLDGSARRATPDLTTVRTHRGPVLVVDDVLTTGASMSAAASALRAAGADEVFGAVVALVPPRHR